MREVSFCNWRLNMKKGIITIDSFTMLAIIGSTFVATTSKVFKYGQA